METVGEALRVDRDSPPPAGGVPAAGCLVLVDKPSGPSSFAMVSLLRRLTRIRRIGHAGTLDPFASGLMVLLVGPACRWQDTVMGADKRYRARLRLGAESDSHDRTGEALPPPASPLPERERIAAALPAFRGEIEQIPPMHSAVQIGGKRLYRLARKGLEVERPPRRVWVHGLELVDWAPPFLDLEIHCGKGMYVRSLARDLGRALGCGALVEELRRTRVGGYAVECALDPAALRAAFAPPAREDGADHAD
jgi:tRNA pseudouridine55 synthase